MVWRRINLCQRCNNADIPYWDTSWVEEAHERGSSLNQIKACVQARVWEAAPRWGCSGNEIIHSPLVTLSAFLYITLIETLLRLIKWYLNATCNKMILFEILKSDHAAFQIQSRIHSENMSFNLIVTFHEYCDHSVDSRPNLDNLPLLKHKHWATSLFKPLRVSSIYLVQWSVIHRTIWTQIPNAERRWKKSRSNPLVSPSTLGPGLMLTSHEENSPAQTGITHGKYWACRETWDGEW